MFPRFQQRCCTGFDTRKPTFLCVVGHKENGANQAANQPVVPFILSRWHQDKLRIILDTAWHSQDMPYATESMSFLTVFFSFAQKRVAPLGLSKVQKWSIRLMNLGAAHGAPDHLRPKGIRCIPWCWSTDGPRASSYQVGRNRAFFWCRNRVFGV